METTPPALINNWGKKKFAFTSSLIPSEWISAFGLQPMPIIPSGAVGHELELPGLCPFTKSFIHEIITNPDIDASISTTSCDQMRRSSELLAHHCSKPVFLFNVPKTVDSPNAVRLYSSELKRLGTFLEDLGGTSPTDEALIDAMKTFEKERESIAGTTECGEGKIPLMLLGGPMLLNHLPVYQIISASGGFIAADGTEGCFASSLTGEEGKRSQSPLDPPLLRRVRTHISRPARFGRRRFLSEPFEVLVESYFPTIPTVDQRPNNRFYQWIKRMIDEQGIRGIIIRYFVWCDLWHAESHRIRKWSPVPVLAFDVDEEEADEARVRSRISAFMEMLR